MPWWGTFGTVIPGTGGTNTFDPNGAVVQGGFLGWLQGAWSDIFGKVSPETQAQIGANTYQGIINAGGSTGDAQKAVGQVNYQIAQSNAAASQANLSSLEKVAIGVAIALAAYAWIFAKASKG